MNQSTILRDLVTGTSDSSKPVTGRMQYFLSKRIFPGFKIGEALAWLLFHFLWAFILGTIYYFGGMFDPKQFMTIESFAFIQLYVLPIKAFFILPCWWIFFILMKNKSILSKALIHIPVSAFYSIAVVATIFLIKSNLSGVYLKKSMVSDIYFNLTFYFSHFALFHAYNFYLDIKEQAKKELALKELAYRSQITALKAQIEPHFLFNTLNSISASVPASLENTRVLVAQLADTFRYALRVSERQEVSLKEEIDFIQNWLALEQYRFKEKLRISFDIDSRCLEVPVPPMLLQPLVENALNHGIAPKVAGGAVHISCVQLTDKVRITVSDTGVGYEGDLNELLNKGIGLKNIAKRLQLLYMEPLQIERNNRKGLTVSFLIPFKDNSAMSGISTYNIQGEKTGLSLFPNSK